MKHDRGSEMGGQTHPRRSTAHRDHGHFTGPRTSKPSSASTVICNVPLGFSSTAPQASSKPPLFFRITGMFNNGNQKFPDLRFSAINDPIIKRPDRFHGTARGIGSGILRVLVDVSYPLGKSAFSTDPRSYSHGFHRGKTSHMC